MTGLGTPEFRLLRISFDRLLRLLASKDKKEMRKRIFFLCVCVLHHAHIAGWRSMSHLSFSLFFFLFVFMHKYLEIQKEIFLANVFLSFLRGKKNSSLTHRMFLIICNGNILFYPVVCFMQYACFEIVL